MSLRPPRLDQGDTTPVAVFLRELSELPILQGELVDGSASVAGAVSVKHALGRPYAGAIVVGCSPSTATVSVELPSRAGSPSRLVDAHCSGACSFRLIVF